MLLFSDIFSEDLKAHVNAFKEAGEHDILIFSNSILPQWFEAGEKKRMCEQVELWGNRKHFCLEVLELRWNMLRLRGELKGEWISFG